MKFNVRNFHEISIKKNFIHSHIQARSTFRNNVDFSGHEF